VLAIWFVVKSGLFTAKSSGLNDAQFKAVLGFIGAGVTATATLIGLLLADAHNKQSEQQTALDIAVKGLALVGSAERNYSPKASVGGALATLIHLGHPIIAMRTLDAAWDDDAVHPSTACWLIGEVIGRNRDNQSVTEAAALLRSNASRLADVDNEECRYWWPPPLLHEWKRKLPISARMDIALAALRLLLTKPKSWWGEERGYLILLLHRAQDDKVSLIRNTVAVALEALLESYRDDDKESIRDARGQKITIEELRSSAAEVGDSELEIHGELERLWESIIDWNLDRAPAGKMAHTQNKPGLRWRLWSR